jgi:signal transduction histidine kinase
VSAQGISDEQCALIGQQRLGSGPFGIAMSEHRRVVVRDAWRNGESLGEAAHTLGFRTVEILPLFGLEGQMVGALAVMFCRSHSTSRRVLQLIEATAQLVVSVVHHARVAVAAERARAVAEEIGRAKVQFLARMSHELRTPLQSIAGYIELLTIGTAEPLTVGQARLLRRARDAELLLVHVIDDLITFSRSEAGQIVYKLAPVQPGDVLRAAEAIVSPLAMDRDVHLTVAEPQSGVAVNADSDKLKQILVNLVVNAVKFTHRGGSVSLRSRIEPQAVTFEVEDTGPGIPAERLSDIFDPYFQLDTHVRDRYGGTGLGLAISHEFAAGMHGKLSVASTVGRGSVFTLNLPRVMVDTTPLPHPIA